MVFVFFGKEKKTQTRLPALVIPDTNADFLANKTELVNLGTV